MTRPTLTALTLSRLRQAAAEAKDNRKATG